MPTKTALIKLRTTAAADPVDVRRLREARQRPDGEAAYRRRQTEAALEIPGPFPFYVTFSIEVGHPVGTCRHVSMRIGRRGRVPSPEAVWLVAELLGFVGACQAWPEALADGGTAIHLVQPLARARGEGSA